MYFWAIATNIPQRLKTGFVLQGHILLPIMAHTALHFNIYTVQLDYTHTLHKYNKSDGSYAHPWHIAYV